MDLARLKRAGVIKTKLGYSTGLVFTYSAYARRMRGYDEYYTGWGSEDVDFVKRLRYCGLELCTIDASSYYLHQWHPRSEGVSEDDFLAQRKRNEDYERRNVSIKRNPAGWGEGELTWYCRASG